MQKYSAIKLKPNGPELTLLSERNPWHYLSTYLCYGGLEDGMLGKSQEKIIRCFSSLNPLWKEEAVVPIVITCWK